MSKQRILLETGTNEVEIAVIRLCGQHFGINVAKIREFIPYEGIEIREIPGSHPCVAGLFLLRDNAIPLVDLQRQLALDRVDDAQPQVVVVTEFNDLVTAFTTDDINRIHRISWADFKPLNPILAMESGAITGSVELEGEEVLILDLEQIIGEIFPMSVTNYDENAFGDSVRAAQRQDFPVYFAEDSSIIRMQVTKILKTVGYENLHAFDNGQACLDAIREAKAAAEAEGGSVADRVALVLTDIEMPRLDGLTLCRFLKETVSKELPVVVFSSLINEQMARKCDSVGADAYVSKPKTDELIRLIDGICGF